VYVRVGNRMQGTPHAGSFHYVTQSTFLCEQFFFLDKRDVFNLICEKFKQRRNRVWKRKINLHATTRCVFPL